MVHLGWVALWAEPPCSEPPGCVSRCPTSSYDSTLYLFFVQDLAWFLCEGLLPVEAGRAVPDAVRRLCATLAPRWRTLVASFGIPVRAGWGLGWHCGAHFPRKGGMGMQQLHAACVCWWHQPHTALFDPRTAGALRFGSSWVAQVELAQPWHAAWNANTLHASPFTLRSR